MQCVGVSNRHEATEQCLHQLHMYALLLPHFDEFSAREQTALLLNGFWTFSTPFSLSHAAWNETLLLWIASRYSVPRTNHCQYNTYRIRLWPRSYIERSDLSNDAERRLFDKLNTQITSTLAALSADDVELSLLRAIALFNASKIDDDDKMHSVFQMPSAPHDAHMLRAFATSSISSCKRTQCKTAM